VAPASLAPWIEGLAARLGAPADGALRSVGIAACSPGEGATTIACAVADRIETVLRRRVLLIDANFRAARLHDEFRLPRAPGLSDLLTGRSTLREAVRAVDGTGLHVMTAGAPSASLVNLFDAQIFDLMKTRLSEAFDLLIFDCPPLSDDADTFVLAKRLDGLVMVLAAEKTRWESGAQSIQRLRAAKVNVLGAALNGKRFFIPNMIYKRL
jgi:Mrp family chromosome partitioning ATPase